ncbi:MAG: ABC transporter permease [Candidatus Firestonebacteria bacterium RIFOXYA2_FULL_40_8]|nr:MAG: ABC transporter permease [Candidatus Firestonebacteria bacterium RIFOXYA2_FULL_40_8]
MNKALIIARRELKSYFVSPVAYVIIGMFLLISGFMYYSILFQSRVAEVRGFLMNMCFVFMLMSPILSMRLLSEEKKLGTIEFLFTSPITVTDIVIGKYLGSIFLYLVTTVFFLQYPLYLLLFATPDMGPVFTCVLGFILNGAACLAIGLFASSLSENQLISAVVGMVTLIFFWIIGWMVDIVPGGIGNFLGSLSLIKPLDNLSKGVISASDIFYYASLIFFFLFITVKRLEWKRW